ncbi:MAG TPA: hypothetical protein VNQ90_16365 [Chthoniobacteraceae bacterium]|nr:hypothetical protein [Chthoniobacteraceae bacterium]
MMTPLSPFLRSLPGPKAVSRHRRRSRWPVLKALAAAALLYAGLNQPAAAQVLYHYEADFSGTGGSLPAGWLADVAPTGARFNLDGSGKLSFDFIGTASSAGKGVAYWAGNAGPVQNGEIADAVVTTVLELPTLHNFQSSGIVARMSETNAADAVGYFAGLYRSSNTNTLVIATDPSGNGFGEVLNTATVTISANTSYLLTFEVTGDQLTATLFDATGENQIISISATDSTYASGTFGLRARSHGADRVFAYSSYQIDVHAVPEPSATAMLSLMAGGLLAFQLARKRKTKTA